MEVDPRAQETHGRRVRQAGERTCGECLRIYAGMNAGRNGKDAAPPTRREPDRRYCLRTVTLAVHHTEELDPGADGFAVLVRHDARELVKMREIVRGPGGEQL